MQIFCRKSIALFLVSVLLLVGVVGVARATTTVATTTQGYLDLIASLTEQINTLKQQMAALQQQRQGGISALLSSLSEGSQGDAVKTLQALLAADPEIYPEGLITGYFGKLTAQAVKRFQSKNGLESVGVVGPKTLAKLNNLLSENPIEKEVDETSGEVKLCAKVPPGHMIAPGWLKKNGARPIVPACQTLPAGIAKKVGTGTSTATTTPDTIAPVISDIDSEVASSSATITWTTNESATSKVYYGTSTPLVLASSTVATVSGLSKDHEVALTGLATSTEYKYVVESADAVGNKATSTEKSLTTEEE